MPTIKATSTTTKTITSTIDLGVDVPIGTTVEMDGDFIVVGMRGGYVTVSLRERCYRYGRSVSFGSAGPARRPHGRGWKKKLLTEATKALKKAVL